MTNREKFASIFGSEIAWRDTGEAVPGHCRMLIAADEYFDEWLNQEYVPASDTNAGSVNTVSKPAVIEAVCTMLKNCFNASEEMLECVKITVGELNDSNSGRQTAINAFSENQCEETKQCIDDQQPVDAVSVGRKTERMLKMGKLIDADAYLKGIRPRGIADELWKASESYLSVMRMPPVDAVPVRRGKWLKEDRGHVEYSAVCDKCGYDTFWCEKSNFCPHCGADMREDGDNG